MIKYNLVIFDLDGTIVYETIFDDVFEILHQFKLNNVKMAIASYNPYAEFFCNRYDITKYFDIICGYTKNDKIQHINEIKSHYKNKGTIFTDNEIIFFDDDIKNINDIKKNTNITCVKINTEKGITKDMINLVI
jgi:predicted phosphatase